MTRTRRHADTPKLTLLALIMTILIACGGGGGGGGGVNVSEPEAQALIGPEGGVVEVTNPESLIYKAKIIIPENALENNTIITMRTKTSSDLPEGSTKAGNCIDLGPDGTVFNIPVRLLMPYQDVDNDGFIDGTDIFEDDLIVYNIEDNSEDWTIADVEYIDSENNTIAINTIHFSPFQAAERKDVDIPITVYRSSIQAIGEEIERKKAEGRFFPISIKSIYETGWWVVIYSPIVIQPIDEPQFEWDYALRLTESEYIDKNDRVESEGYTEIFSEQWKYPLAEEYYLGIWAKNYAKIHKLEKVEVIEYPFSFAYTNIKEPVNIGAMLFTESIEAIIKSIGIPYAGTALSIYSYIDMTTEIMDYIADQKRALVSIVPYSDNADQSEVYEFIDTRLSRTHRGTISTLNKTAEKISADLMFDFIRTKYLRDQKPSEFFSNLTLGIQLSSTISCSNEFYSSDVDDNWNEVFTSSDEPQFRKGRFYIIRPKLDSDLFWNVPKVDCFFIGAKDQSLFGDLYKPAVYSRIDMVGDDDPNSDSVITKVASGGFHTVVLKGDGTIWAWGSNSFGQVGNGTDTNQYFPVQVGTDHDWADIAPGGRHTLALKHDGTLWAWGYNSLGTLGDGTYANRYQPVQIGTDSDWAAISSGFYHCLALKQDGTLWAWGVNLYGQIGNGTEGHHGNMNTPTRIGYDTDWVTISAHWQSLAIKADGTLWAWGSNAYGQLGDGTTYNRNIPTQIGSNKDWLIIEAGGTHTIGIKTDGTLWAWGSNENGQLGDGTLKKNYYPAQIGHDTTWQKVTAGYWFSQAIKSDRTLWAWGKNDDGQLGDGTNTDRYTPTKIAQQTNCGDVYAGSGHNISLKNDNTIWTWGRNSSGQLGNGTNINKNSPIQIF